MYWNDVKRKSVLEKSPALSDSQRKIRNIEELKGLTNTTPANGIVSDSMDGIRRELSFDREANNSEREQDSLLNATHVQGNHRRDFSAEVEDIEEAIPPSISSSSLQRSYEYVSRFVSVPIRWLFHHAFPSLHPSEASLPFNPSASAPEEISHELVPLWRACSVLFASILCISILASVIVVISESFVSNLGIGTATMGATLVALGSEVRY